MFGWILHSPAAARRSHMKPRDALQALCSSCMSFSSFGMFRYTHWPGWPCEHMSWTPFSFFIEQKFPVPSIQSTCTLPLLYVWFTRAPIQNSRVLLPPTVAAPFVMHRDELNSASRMVASCMPLQVQVWFACSQVLLSLSYLVNLQAVTTATTSEQTAISLYPENVTTKCACVSECVHRLIWWGSTQLSALFYPDKSVAVGCVGLNIRRLTDVKILLTETLKSLKIPVTMDTEPRAMILASLLPGNVHYNKKNIFGPLFAVNEPMTWWTEQTLGSLSWP